MLEPVDLVHLDRVDSTNEEARRRLAAGLIHRPTAIVAREQTAGRGTRGRTWDSPPDAGLYLSLVLPGNRPPLAGPGGGHAAGVTAGPATDPAPGPPLQLVHTLAAGVAAAEAVSECFGVPVRLKPINDLLVGEAKLGGILVETTVREGRIASMVVGIGINLRGSDRRVRPDGLEATTIERERPRSGGRDRGSAGVDAAEERLFVERLIDGLLRWADRTVTEGEATVGPAWDAWAIDGAVRPTAGIGRSPVG